MASLVPALASAQTGKQFEAEIGIGQLGNDWLLTTRLGFLYFDEVGGIGCGAPELGAPATERCTAPIGVGLQIPIRFEVVDQAPTDDDVVRTEDWDEPGDFFRIVRFVEYGRRHQPLFVRFGELGGVVLGHGSVVNGYMNTVTAGDFNPGIELAANTAYGGINLMLNDVSRPEIFGGRAFVRPWGFGDQTRWWHRFAVGLTAVSDVTAPVELDRCEPGELCDPLGYFGAEPDVSATEPVTVVGIDAEVAVVDNDHVEFLPYLDLNASLGFGAHLGAALRVAIGDHWATSLRLEGRALGPNYMPGYFGPLYQLNRFRTGGWGTQVAAPKARIAASQDDAAFGAFGQLGLSWREYASLSFAMSEHDGPSDASAWLRLTVTPPGPFTMGAYWAKQNVDPVNFLKLDGALLATEARLTIWGPLYVHGRFDRLWQLTPDARYEPTNEWTAGFGAAFPIGD